MPRARFNHAAHTTEPCTACHNTAERSKHSSDILMPGIAKCRSATGAPATAASSAPIASCVTGSTSPTGAAFDARQHQARLLQ